MIYRSDNNKSIGIYNIYKDKKLSDMILSVLITLAFFAAVIISGLTEASAIDELPNDAVETPGVAGGAFEVTKYELNTVVNKDHSYDVEEKISVNIPDQLQKIEFSIPSGNFRISGITVEDTAYSANRASEASTVTIEDPAKLEEGSHVYTIRYKISCFADRDESADMFYYDALLPEWKQPIGKVTISAKFPKDFPFNDIQCYAGQFGVQDVTNKISFNVNDPGKTVVVKGSMIPENFGITLKAQLPDGYWEGALDGIWAVYAVMGIMAGAALLLLILWLIGGRDPRIKREAVTKPVEGVYPHELGYIFNSEVSIRDIVLLILRLAINGYLRISEYEPKRYRLYRLEDPVSEEKHIRNAYSILFDGVYKGRSVEMSELGRKLHSIRLAIREDVASGYADSDSLAYTPLSRAFRIAGGILLSLCLGAADALGYMYGYFSVNYFECAAVAFITAAALFMLCRNADRQASSPESSSRFGVMMSATVLLAVVSYVAFSVYRRTGYPAASLLIPVMSVISVILIVLMRARGKKNAELVSRFRQLRNFIYHPTPKELLKNHLINQEYYYDMLPYALAFGAEEAWAISFLTLDVPEPGWYSDDIEGHAFSNLRESTTTIDYARDIRSFMRTIENAYNDMYRYSRIRTK